ncbi:MAG TPA: hypothetical protein VMD75_01615 [Candidatus Binataceae bacterium]|nr:hypothetical protein [Candidatus Binataceae bacterium]
MQLQPSALKRLHGFFLGLTRKSFSQLGVGDNRIAEYVAEVLTEFSFSDRWLRMRAADGRRITSVVEMLVAQLEPEHPRLDERQFRKYVGDYTLFMSGLFRRYVERDGHLRYYIDEGRRSYEKVSALDAAHYRPGFLVFEELSKGFEYYSGALDYMRKCFFVAGPHDDPFGGFLRQIEGWVRTSRSDN